MYIYFTAEHIVPWPTKGKLYLTTLYRYICKTLNARLKPKVI